MDVRTRQRLIEAVREWWREPGPFADFDLLVDRLDDGFVIEAKS